MTPVEAAQAAYRKVRNGLKIPCIKAVREYAKAPDNHSGYLVDVGAAKDFVDLHWAEISR